MKNDLKNRTFNFSISIINLVEEIDYSQTKKIVTNQLARSATSVGANYRAACRSRSDREFISKMNIVLEEIDECCFWLEIIKNKEWIKVDSFLNEANELTAIVVSSLKTIKKRLYENKNL
jgi:four helix bundle protein